MNKLKQALVNRLSPDLKNIELMNSNEFHIEIENKNIRKVCSTLHLGMGLPLVDMFANDERVISGGFCIYYVFADYEASAFILLKLNLAGEERFDSIASVIFASSGYEREIHDLFGLEPVGHPDLKRLVHHGNWPEGNFPLRKDFDKSLRLPFSKNNSNFAKVDGEGVFEIPVGPVHAGIIEPGHFRFSVAGEPILNLEAQLYFVHKGIEKMCEGMDLHKCFYVSERISGDETISNSLAFCQAAEKIAGIDVPERALLTRVVFAELERMTSHFGDLAGVCLDVAYGFAGFQFRMLRGWCYALADELCGMRFLRSVNALGGVRCDFIKGKEKKVLEMVLKIEKELLDTIEIIKSNSLFIDRIENTGILKTDIARDLNATGPAGRAAGLKYDVRKSFPYAAYQKLEFKIPEHHNGDVNCRVNVKLEECLESISIIMQTVGKLHDGKIRHDIGTLPAYKASLSVTESPRGENVHWLMTGENNTVYRYKVRTPSFCNWPALCHAVKGNIVPDFPLVNKSFNLSYAGNDL
ncbi:MAG TPA: NADH-quinone oxidoreductase subunit C [Clostridia bacterium]